MLIICLYSTWGIITWVFTTIRLPLYTLIENGTYNNVTRSNDQIYICDIKFSHPIGIITSIYMGFGVYLCTKLSWMSTVDMWTPICSCTIATFSQTAYPWQLKQCYTQAVIKHNFKTKQDIKHITSLIWVQWCHVSRHPYSCSYPRLPLYLVGTVNIPQPHPACSNISVCVYLINIH